MTDTPDTPESDPFGEAVTATKAAQPAPSVQATSPPVLPVLTARPIEPGLKEATSQIFFRQSFLKDYLRCPQMALYRWVYAMEEEDQFFAALLGTAGHEVIFRMHDEKRIRSDDADSRYGFLELTEMFHDAFRATIKQADNLPRLSRHHESWESELIEKAPYYVEMLDGYQHHKQNKTFHATMREQAFVLSVPNETDPSSPFIFTGQIDQAGYYADGKFVLRDIKFRDNAFRPGRTELDLDPQMTVYCMALKYGSPACKACKPVIEEDAITGVRKLHYNGPCLDCSRKIGTHHWPRRWVERAEIIWMRDFERRKKDEFAREVQDKTLPRAPQGKGGRLIFQWVPNPKWATGYRKGDYSGPCFLHTYRTPTKLEILMQDLLHICQQIREGVFYRNPGDTCNFFCKYKEQCVGGVKMAADEIDLTKASAYGTEDPF